MKHVRAGYAAVAQAAAMLPLKGFANLTAQQLADAAATSLTTARRWRRLEKAPRPIMKALEITAWGELGEIAAPWSGWRLDPHTGELWTSQGWAITPGEILALPFQHQRIRGLEAKVRELKGRASQESVISEPSQTAQALKQVLHGAG